MGKDLIKDENNEIVQKISDNPLKDIHISVEEADKLLAETVGEKIADMVPFVGDIVSGLNLYQQKIDNARLLILLSDFRANHENTEKFQNAIKKLITTPSGINLFQKVVRIINANAVDLEYIKLLANVLKNISDSDFEELFQEHNYVLSQIEKITPQALLVLKDNAIWPSIMFSSSHASGVTTGKDWDTAFATQYLDKKSITDKKINARIVNVINELRNNNIVGLESTHVPLTPIGEEIYRYLQ